MSSQSRTFLRLLFLLGSTGDVDTVTVDLATIETETVDLADFLVAGGISFFLLTGAATAADFLVAGGITSTTFLLTGTGDGDASGCTGTGDAAGTSGDLGTGTGDDVGGDLEMERDNMDTSGEGAW